MKTAALPQQSNVDLSKAELLRRVRDKSARPNQVTAAIKDLRKRDLLQSQPEFVSVITAFRRLQRWQDAVSALFDICQRRFQPDSFAFGATVSACEWCEQWPYALALLNHMAEENLVADVITYSSAINACSKRSEWQWALHLLADMKATQVTPNIIACSAAINACEKSLQWELAIGLLKQACQGHLKPDTVAYGAVVSACARCAEWEQALAILKKMHQDGTRLDICTCSAAVNACEKALQWELAFELLRDAKCRRLVWDVVAYGATARLCEIVGDWQQAVKLLGEMQQVGIEADEVIYGAVLGACEKGNAIGLGVGIASQLAVQSQAVAVRYDSSMGFTWQVAGTDQVASIDNFRHTPVMLQEVVDAFTAASLGRNAVIVDCTVGGGGHSEALLDRLPGSRLLGIDQDPEALRAAQQRLAHFDPGRVHLAHGNFREVPLHLARSGFGTSMCDGLLADLGVSSPQLDVPIRGFSFRADGPLDMRMDPSSPNSRPASWHLATISVDELSQHFREFDIGDKSELIASCLLTAQPQTTKHAANIIRECVRSTGEVDTNANIDPAQKTFQALRILVNREFDSLACLLDAAERIISPGGLLCIISFHTLEDRLVKRAILGENSDLAGASPLGCAAFLRAGGCDGVRPTAEEVTINRRCRSARMRLAIRRAHTNR